jgi:hypothetical protein
MSYTTGMLYGVFADIVVFVHFLWILFLIFGGLIGIRIRMVKIAHVAGLIFAVVLQVTGWYCPLTDLEAWLRTGQSSGAAYGGSFITHYIERIVYVQVPGVVIFFLTIVLCLFNAWLYIERGKKGRRKNDINGAP